MTSGLDFGSTAATDMAELWDHTTARCLYRPTPLGRTLAPWILRMRIFRPNLEAAHAAFQFGSFIRRQCQRHMARQRTSTALVGTSH